MIIKKNELRINSMIERFFVISGIIILLTSLFIGLYFNKYNEQENRKNNYNKIHSMLSQLIIPSLSISDSSEVRRLLYMASSKDVTFLVIDNSEIVIMSDYANSSIEKFAVDSYRSGSNCNKLSMVYKYISGKKYLVNCSILNDRNFLFGNKKPGILLSLSDYEWFSFSFTMFYFMAILVALFMFLIVLFRKILYRNLLLPLVTLKDRIKNVSISHAVPGTCVGNIINAPRELMEIKQAFDKLLLTLNEEYARRFEAEKIKALVDFSAIVAHDIRSPLAVMEMVIASSKRENAQENNVILRQAIQSVRDLANNLLTRYRDSETKVDDKCHLYPSFHEYNNMIQSILVFQLLETLMSHKKQEWYNRNITIRYSPTASEKFYRIEAVQSKVSSMLSNLLNNSYESFSLSGIIDIKVERSSNYLRLSIQDNGNGIPEDQIHHVLNGNSSKHPGKGMGLSGAKIYMESLGGNLLLSSQQGIGTSVILTFPYRTSDDLFPEKICLSKDATIIILDDDKSIHSMWRHRLSTYSVKLMHFYSYNEAVKWVSIHSEKYFIYLVDLNLGEHQLTGLDFLELINENAKRYLVTNNTEEIQVQKRAAEMGVQLISKALVADIQIFLL